MGVTNLVACLWIRYKWWISAMRLGEQADIPYSTCRRTNAPYKEMKRRFLEILEGVPYYEDQFSCLICGHSVLSRGR